MHYKYQENLKIYQLNQLAFKGQNKLKLSKYIQQIIIPSQGLIDTNNPNRDYQYTRLISQANYINYPQICLDNMLGMTDKGEPQIKVPAGMQSIIEFATPENQSLNSLLGRSLEYLCKYGLAAIRATIQNDVSITQTPKLEVVAGNKIADFKTYKNQDGIDVFKFVLIDKTKRVFNEISKMYVIKRRYLICALDENGQYYQATIQNGMWAAFNLEKPWESNYYQLVYPEFYGRLNFVPIVCFNPYHVKMSNDENYNYTSAIQTLINLTLNIFQQDANLKQSLHMQANPTLFVHGSNAKPKDILLGPYSVNILKDSSSKAEYVSPNFGGINLQKETLDSMKVQAQTMIYSILNAAGNASGDSLAIRLQAATLNLISLVKNIGDAITNALQNVAIIMNLNPEECEFIPYTGFGTLETGQQIKDQVLTGEEQTELKNNEEDTNNQDIKQNNKEIV